MARTVTRSRKAGFALLLALPMLLPTTGCFYRLAPGGRMVVAPPPAGAPQCRPNQYWDGTMCRHKGQGHGARKHDGR
jgi:hypothetical protein